MNDDQSNAALSEQMSDLRAAMATLAGTSKAQVVLLGKLLDEATYWREKHESAQAEMLSRLNTQSFYR